MTKDEFLSEVRKTRGWVRTSDDCIRRRSITKREPLCPILFVCVKVTGKRFKIGEEDKACAALGLRDPTASRFINEADGFPDPSGELWQACGVGG